MNEKTSFITDAVVVAAGIAFYATSIAYIFSKMTADYSIGLISL